MPWKNEADIVLSCSPPLCSVLSTWVVRRSNVTNFLNYDSIVPPHIPAQRPHFISVPFFTFPRHYLSLNMQPSQPLRKTAFEATSSPSISSPNALPQFMTGIQTDQTLIVHQFTVRQIMVRRDVVNPTNHTSLLKLRHHLFDL
jgi:hypothetical protein